MTTQTDDDAYFDALEAADRDALKTAAAGVILTLLFWGAIFLTADIAAAPGRFPLWFCLAVAGGYVASILLALWIVRTRKGERDDLSLGVKEK